MRIACLQFAPALGDVDNNLNRADAVLDHADPQDLDLLVLPEMAFTGYNFKSLGEITRYLEPSGSGITSLWARSQALKHDCTVIAGYPERVDPAEDWPASPEYYNSAAVINSDGEDIGNYRKSHLYYTDQSWALEGSGFFCGSLDDIGTTTLGICMDLNPYKFEAPWDKFEFATHALKNGAKLVVLSMAWITHEDQRSFIQTPEAPDMDTLSYWISRIEPIIRTDSGEETIVVFANRTGVENDATYTGTSAVVGVKSGEVSVYGILGRGEKKLLVVDTDDQPFAKLVYRPEVMSTKVGEPEPPKPVGQTTPPHETNGRGSNPGTPTESPHSKRQQGEETPSFRSQGRSTQPSSDTRDAFSVKRHEKNQFDPQSRDTGVQTPSAPSPTPHDIRPQFSAQSVSYPVIQPPKSSVPTYGDFQPSIPYNEPISDEPMIIDPEATARRLGLIRDRSPSNRSESHNSDYSIGSSKLYWNPREQAEVKATLRPRFDNMEQLISEFDSIAFSDNKRHSLRSDIAVWNNEPGHPREKISVPHVSQEPKLRSTLHAVERKRSPARTSNRSVHRSRNAPPGMAKSRNESRPGRLDQSVSSILPPPDMVAACERFEAFAQRAETAQGRYESMRDTDRGGEIVQSNENTRTTNSVRQRSAKPPSQSKVKRKPSKGSMSVPFAMDPSVLRDSNRSKTTFHERSTSSIGGDPPVLRPASRSRINRDMSRGRGPENNTALPDTTIPNNRVHGARPITQEHRAMSRGRSRSTGLSEMQSPDPSGSRRRHRDAHKRQESAQDATNLAQYERIEEYPSANCPVHGSRSRSRAGHRNPSHQRNAGTPHSRQQSSSRQVKDVQRSVHNTPQTGNRRAPSSAKVPFKLTTDLGKSSRTIDSSAQQGQQRSNGPVSAVPSSASTLSPGQDPKTPVAMILIPDGEEIQRLAQLPWVPTANGIERDIDVSLAKPLSVGY